MSDKKYLGCAKVVETQYGTIMKVSFSKADLEYMAANVNEKQYINLDIMTRREPTEYATHSIKVNTWQPNQQSQQQQDYNQTTDMLDQEAFSIPGEEMF